jgi:hemerythrin
MRKLVWTQDLNLGIEVIDEQHIRIVEYINELDDVRTSNNKREEVGRIIDAMLDYTISHFTFEERMQEEAGYPYIKEHKKVHELFISKITDFQERFNQGADVADDLHKLLFKWLYSHIQHDDLAYVKIVKENIKQGDFVEKNKGFFSKLFS